MMTVSRIDESYTTQDLSYGGWYVDDAGTVVFSSVGSGMVVVFTKGGSDPYIENREKWKGTLLRRCSRVDLIVNWM